MCWWSTGGRVTLLNKHMCSCAQEHLFLLSRNTNVFVKHERMYPCWTRTNPWPYIKNTYIICLTTKTLVPFLTRVYVVLCSKNTGTLVQHECVRSRIKKHVHYVQQGHMCSSSKKNTCDRLQYEYLYSGWTRVPVKHDHTCSCSISCSTSVLYRGFQ